MKILFFIVCFLTISFSSLFAQSDDEKSAKGEIKTESKDVGVTKPEQEIKAVPISKGKKAKPAKVNHSRPSLRPARNTRPAARPVRPGNGRH